MDCFSQVVLRDHNSGSPSKASWRQGGSRGSQEVAKSQDLSTPFPTGPELVPVRACTTNGIARIIDIDQKRPQP